MVKTPHGIAANPLVFAAIAAWHLDISDLPWTATQAENPDDAYEIEYLATKTLPALYLKTNGAATLQWDTAKSHITYRGVNREGVIKLYERPLPDTLLVGLPGATLDRVVAIPGASDMTIVSAENIPIRDSIHGNIIKLTVMATKYD